jgi:hypothetical protein
MGRSLLSALLWLRCSIFHLDAHTLQGPGTVASDPGITGKMATGHCLPYAIALGDGLLQRSGITVADIHILFVTLLRASNMDVRPEEARCYQVSLVKDRSRVRKINVA